MNKFNVTRNLISHAVIVRVVNEDATKVRQLTEQEMKALENVLNEVEFEQNIDQNEF